MSMDQAPENNLPPHTDAAHRDPAAGTGLRLGGDWTRERDALRRQVAACERENTDLKVQLAELESHNAELYGVIEVVREWCEANQRAARNRAAQTGDPDWQIRQRVISEVWEIVKPIV